MLTVSAREFCWLHWCRILGHVEHGLAIDAHDVLLTEKHVEHPIDNLGFLNQDQGAFCGADVFGVLFGS